MPRVFFCYWFYIKHSIVDVIIMIFHCNSLFMQKKKLKSGLNWQNSLKLSNLINNVFDHTLIYSYRKVLNSFTLKSGVFLLPLINLLTISNDQCKKKWALPLNSYIRKYAMPFYLAFFSSIWCKKCS